MRIGGRSKYYCPHVVSECEELARVHEMLGRACFLLGACDERLQRLGDDHLELRSAIQEFVNDLEQNKSAEATDEDVAGGSENNVPPASAGRAS